MTTSITAITARVIKALAHVMEAGRKERMMEMFNQTSDEFREKEAPELIKWAGDVLKKEDRMVWFLKKVRNLDKQFLENNKKAEQDWKKERSKGGYASQKDPVEWLKQKLGHFMETADSNNYRQVLEYKWPKDILSLDLVKELEEHEKEAIENAKESAERFIYEDAEVFVPINEKWEWQLIEKEYCETEGDAMDHCGNKSQVTPGDRILSLREKTFYKGEQVWKPHLTFILNNGRLGEMKGYANSKPDKKYHPMILELLFDDRIKKMGGGKYKRENDFKIKDLSEEDFKKLKEKRPDLAAKPTLDEETREDLIDRLDDEIRAAERQASESEGAWDYLSDSGDWSLDNLSKDTLEHVKEYMRLVLEDEGSPASEIEERLDDEREIIDFISKNKNITEIDYSDTADDFDDYLDLYINEYEEVYIDEELANELDDLSEAELEDVLAGAGLSPNAYSGGYLNCPVSDCAALKISEFSLQEKIDDALAAREWAEKKPTFTEIKKVLENMGGSQLKYKALDMVKTPKQLAKLATNRNIDSQYRSAAIERITDVDVLKQLLFVGNYYHIREVDNMLKNLLDEKEYLKLVKEILTKEDVDPDLIEHVMYDIKDPKLIKLLLRKKQPADIDENYVDVMMRGLFILKNNKDPQWEQYAKKLILNYLETERLVDDIKDRNWLLKALKKLSQVPDSESSEAHREKKEKVWDRILELTKAKELPELLEMSWLPAGMKSSIVHNIKSPKFLYEYLQEIKNKDTDLADDIIMRLVKIAKTQKMLFNLVMDESLSHYMREMILEEDHITDKSYLKKIAEKFKSQHNENNLAKYARYALDRISD